MRSEALRRARGPEPHPGTGEGPPRVLGRVVGGRAGPTLVCVGGVHGNEPAGVRGLQRILDDLGGGGGPDLQGEFLALVGNRQALARHCRFLDLDLNRAWTRDRVEDLRDPRPAGALGAEGMEQRELLEELDAAAARARGPLYVLDLHTTSGHGGVFATAGDTLRNRAFALCFPAPLILGLEEQVEGTLVEYLESRGYVCAAFESGQHDDPRSVDLAEAAIWIALAAAGLVPEEGVPQVTGARKLMARESEGLPRVLEMRHRHPVSTGDAFVMNPGWRNFQPVGEGEVLARDAGGDIRAPESGRLLMPLYQEQGEDGFFVIREFNAIWLRISAILRKLGADRIVHWLPGIHRTGDGAPREALTVDRRVARWYALELLHLLGYRKHQEEGTRLVVHPRRFDVPPEPGAGGGQIGPEDGTP